MDVETSNDQMSEGSSIKVWISAMRLRTLPLSVASILTGGFLALQHKMFDGWVLALAILTTVLLQINSNFANDFGDYSHGTDNDERIGPARTLQAGLITPKQMRMAIIVCSLLSLLSGMVLLYVSSIGLWLKLILFALGILAIYASITYTAGPRPYGYRGLGDASVILFFGFLGVIGSYALHTGTVDAWILLPAITIGAFSAGVLNVNNTRDIDSDRNSGKMTLAAKLGPQRARAYQVILLLLGWSCMVIYAFQFFAWGWSWLFAITLPLFILNGFKVAMIKEARKLDPFLKQLALSTFLFSLLLGLGVFLSAN